MAPLSTSDSRIASRATATESVVPARGRLCLRLRIPLALVGGAGGGAIGSTTKDPAVTFVAAVIGGLAGSDLRRDNAAVIMSNQADRHPYGGWQFTELQPEPFRFEQEPYSPFA